MIMFKIQIIVRTKLDNNVILYIIFNYVVNIITRNLKL